MFFILAMIAIFGSVMFILTSHPVQTILSLIVVACSVSGLCLLADAEFLGFLFVVVYVGAIAVLFLFVVMMISVNAVYEEDFKPLYDSFFILAISVIVQVLFFFQFSFSYTAPNVLDVDSTSWANLYFAESSLSMFNIGLYHGFLALSTISAGVLLLVSMIGSIFLTVQDYSTSKTQSIYMQVSRSNEIFICRLKNPSFN